MAINRCAGMNKGNGLRCKKTAVEGEEYCRIHLDACCDVASEDMQDTTMASDVVQDPVIEQEQPKPINIKVKIDQATLDDLIGRINKLEMKVSEAEAKAEAAAAKKTRKVDALKKAKMLFYHDIKRHEEVLAEIVRRGIPMIERKKVCMQEGVATPYFSYPWWEVKRVTDAAFENLDVQKRNWYIGLSLPAHAP